MTSSVLVGNGIDIQIGGYDYLNKWIIVRLLANAKSGKYDELFKSGKDTAPSLTGDELIKLFLEMPLIANKARNGEYDSLLESSTEQNILPAIDDFKRKYIEVIKSPEEIGLEDWFLLLRLFLQEQPDLLPLYNDAKQGFERVILDAIYCNGSIQQLHKRIIRKAKEYFCGFDNIFTLNYDNTLEKLTKKSVFHLHGDFATKALSENPNTAYGYWRYSRGQSVWYPPQYSHCNCNAILDFSGNNKYQLAVSLSNAATEFDKLKSLYNDRRSEFELFLAKFPIEQQKIIRVGVEKNLPFGYNYHFQDLEQLTGELIIIGIAPQNDSHLFECINKSNLDSVVFYHFFAEAGSPEPTLTINKAYVVRDVNLLWESLGQSPTTSHSRTAYNFWRHPNKQKFVDIFNAFEIGDNSIDSKEVYKQLKTIPPETEKAIINMMNTETRKEKYHTKPLSEEELYRQFRDFGRTLITASISPQTLYFLYISNLSRHEQPGKKPKKR